MSKILIVASALLFSLFTTGAQASSKIDESAAIIRYDAIHHPVKNRAIMAKNGSILARVEYSKNSGGRHIAITHAGAQIAARTIFMPEAWPLRLSAFDPQGTPKQGECVEQDIAGPCCFAGDVIAHRRKMPKLEANDLVLLHDTGAYYYSNPFFYNSLPVPAVYGYRRNEQGEVEFEQYRAQQTIEEMMAVIG